jgi:putative GTP pyrophosphokinase
MSGDLTEAIPNRAELETDYERRRPAYQSVLEDFGKLVNDRLESVGIRTTIKGRVKSFESLYRKKIRLLRQAKLAGKDKPIPITDIVGIRVVCPFLGDLERAVKAISSSFHVTEIERKGAERSFREFGYESIHLLVELPQELGAARPGLDIRTCEIQLRTILQEAWAEVEHELVYKADFTPFDEPMKRKLAALNANLSLSDIIFQEIRDYQHRLTEELSQRRNDFYTKIEESIDVPFRENLGAVEPRRLESLQVSTEEGGSRGEPMAPAGGEASSSGRMPPSLDDMLLEALYVHNRGRYSEAIRIYGEILAEKPPKEVAAVIHKHRGMAFFSESRYEESIADFGKALEFDPRCFKAAYYRGVVNCVLEDYARAVEDFDLSLAINPFQSYSLYRRAQAYWHLGDYPKVLADCEGALKIEPEQPQAAALKLLALEKLKM